MTETAVMRGPGVRGITAPSNGAIATLANESEVRASFVDLRQPETGKEIRIPLDPLETTTVTLAPGEIDVTLGLFTRLEIA